MGLENLQYRQSLNLLVPHHVPSSARMHAYAKSCLPSTHRGSNPPSAYRLAHQSTLFRSSRNFRSPGMKRNCTSDHYNEAFNEEIKRLVRYLADNFDEKDVADRNGVEVFHGVEDSFNVSGGNETRQDRWSSGSGSFFPSKRDFLEPDFLGIKPDPPEWPGRAEFVMMDIQRKANSFDIPFSLRIIKRKRRWQESFVDAGDYSYCSVNKAFSSMVFMIRELQSYALCTRDSVCSEDLQSVSKDLNTSFVWLFQRVFAKTPNLMLYLMLILANFTVQSMVKNTEDGISDRNGGDKLCFGNGVPNVLNEFSAPGTVEVTQEEKEEGLWKPLVEEASCMQSGSGSDITQQLGLSGTVEIEPDDYVEYSRTDLFYQLRLAEDPTNSLLLSNYAQFLCLVPHDYDRAEECFKRAVETETQDAMALSHYADFLWSVRNDLWGAEERYQQAMEVEPSSHYHSSKYAAFLWNTGGIETCFYMDSPNDDKN